MNLYVLTDVAALLTILLMGFGITRTANRWREERVIEKQIYRLRTHTTRQVGAVPEYRGLRRTIQAKMRQLEGMRRHRRRGRRGLASSDLRNVSPPMPPAVNPTRLIAPLRAARWFVPPGSRDVVEESAVHLSSDIRKMQDEGRGRAFIITAAVVRSGWVLFHVGCDELGRLAKRVAPFLKTGG